MPDQKITTKYLITMHSNKDNSFFTCATRLSPAVFLRNLDELKPGVFNTVMSIPITSKEYDNQHHIRK